MKLLLTDLDGTIRRTLSGKRFTNDPDDQELIPGAIEVLTRYHDDGFTIFGITNQGGVAAGHKSIQECVTEQRRTIELTDGLIDLILFCPGDGRTLHVVDLETTKLVRAHQTTAHAESPYTGFRKPNAGMLNYAITATNVHMANCCMVGDHYTDELAAFHAGCYFLDAEDFRNPDTALSWRSPRDAQQLNDARVIERAKQDMATKGVRGQIGGTSREPSQSRVRGSECDTNQGTKDH